MTLETGSRGIRAAAVLALLLPVGGAAQQRAEVVQATAGSVERTAPLEARLRAGDQSRVVTLIGRVPGKIVFTDADTAAGLQRQIDVAQVEEAVFRFTLDDLELMKAVRRRRWERAYSLIVAAIQPTLPYLDLPHNNAAQLALDAGDYMMRAADLHARRRGEEGAQEAAEERYQLAYTLLRYAGRAGWYSGGMIADIKRMKCLLQLGKPRTARHYFENIEPPFPGDAAYGLYWLVKAELEIEREAFREAMDAAVKSLCFENKNVDTFPDALLVSARCYEELQQWHRARDVYFEVAKIFPRTDWQDAAVTRLRFIMDRGLTGEEETLPIENVFFGLKEDMNLRVREFLDGLAVASDEPTDLYDEEIVRDLDAEAAERDAERDLDAEGDAIE